MQPKLPLVPPEIAVLPDLLHGAYPGSPRIAGNNVQFHDMLLFLVQHGVPRPTFEQGTKAGSSEPDAVMIIWRRPGDESVPVRRDARDITGNFNSLVSDLAREFALVLPRYPGYDLRHPNGPAVVGSAWPDHPHATEGKRYYRATAEAKNRFSSGDTHAEIRDAGDSPAQTGTVRRFRYDWSQTGPNMSAYCWIDETRPGEFA